MSLDPLQDALDQRVKDEGPKALDMSRIKSVLDAGQQAQSSITDAATSARAKLTAAMRPVQADSKVFYIPSKGAYYVGGKQVGADFANLNYLADHYDTFADQSEAPPGSVPMKAVALRSYRDLVNSQMKGTAATQFTDALITGTVDAGVGVANFFGFDAKNPYANLAQDDYSRMDIREQAGVTAKAFDSRVGFTNALAQGLGSAAPIIAGGTIAAALAPEAAIGATGAALLGAASTARTVGTVVGTTLGATEAFAGDARQARQNITDEMTALSENDRRKSSDAYAAAVDHGLSPEAAIDEVAKTASWYAGAVGAATTIPETLLGAKFLGGFASRYQWARNLGAVDNRTATQIAKAAASKVPKALRDVARIGGVGLAEGVQEETENATSLAAGNAAAGVGETNPFKLVDGQNFEQALPVGLLFGMFAHGGGHRAGAPTDLGLATEQIEGGQPPPVASPAPLPPGDGQIVEAPEHLQLQDQLSHVEEQLQQAGGANWQDVTGHLSQMPEVAPLLQQYAALKARLQELDPQTPAPEPGPVQEPAPQSLPNDQITDAPPEGLTSPASPQTTVPGAVSQSPVASAAREQLANIPEIQQLIDTSDANSEDEFFAQLPGLLAGSPLGQQAADPGSQFSQLLRAAGLSEAPTAEYPAQAPRLDVPLNPAERLAGQAGIDQQQENDTANQFLTQPTVGDALKARQQRNAAIVPEPAPVRDVQSELDALGAQLDSIPDRPINKVRRAGLMDQFRALHAELQQSQSTEEAPTPTEEPAVAPPVEAPVSNVDPNGIETPGPGPEPAVLPVAAPQEVAPHVEPAQAGARVQVVALGRRVLGDSRGRVVRNNVALSDDEVFDETVASAKKDPKTPNSFRQLIAAAQGKKPKLPPKTAPSEPATKTAPKGEKLKAKNRKATQPAEGENRAGKPTPTSPVGSAPATKPATPVVAASVAGKSNVTVDDKANIPSAWVKLARDWVSWLEKTSGQSFAPIHLTTIAGARTAMGRMPAYKSRRTTTRGLVTAYRGVNYIGLDWPVAVNDDSYLETFAHEFGHVISRHVYAQASPETRAALDAAYAKWNAEHRRGKSTKAEVGKSRYTPLRAAKLDPPSMGYALDRDEWDADMVARWLLKRGIKPKGLIETHFAKVAAMLRLFFDHAFGAGEWHNAMENWIAGTREQGAATRSSTPADATFNDADSASADENGKASAAAVKPILAPLLGEKVEGWRKRMMRSKFGQKLREGALSLHSIHQMADTYKTLGRKAGEARGAVSQLLEEIATLRDRVIAQSNKNKALGSNALAGARNLSNAARAQLQRVMYLAGTYGIHPEVGFDAPSNKHLQSADPEMLAENKKRYTEVREEYDKLVKLDGNGGAVYSALRVANREQRLAELKQMLEQLNNPHINQVSPATREKMAKEIEADIAAVEANGPYFHQHREGDWIVDAHLPLQKFGSGAKTDGAAIDTKSNANAVLRKLKHAYPGSQFNITGTDGDFFVTVLPKAHYVFQSEQEAKDAKSEIEKDMHERYGPLMQDNMVVGTEGPYGKASNYNRDMTVAPAFLKLLKKELIAKRVSQSFYNSAEEMYIRSLQEFSSRKTELHRENVLGASKDMLEAFAKNYNSKANRMAKLSQQRIIDAKMQELLSYRKTHAEVATIHQAILTMEEAIETRAKDNVTNTIANVVAKVSTGMALALSPAFILMNGAQPHMIGAPVLGAAPRKDGKAIGMGVADAYIRDAYTGNKNALVYFGVQGVKDMRSAYEHLMKRGTADANPEQRMETLIKMFARTPAEEALLHEMVDHNELDMSLLDSLHDAMAGGSDLGNVLRFGLAMARQGEIMNRMVMATASHRVAVKEIGMDAGTASAFARKVTRDTQLDYSRHNRPATFNRPVVGSMLQFRLYQQGIYFQFAHNIGQMFSHDTTPAEKAQARRVVTNLFATHAAMAGIDGLGPVSFMAKAALVIALRGMGDDKDKWLTDDDLIRAALDPKLGKGGTNVLLRGLPTVVGLDVSDRMGIPDLMNTKYARVSERDDPQTAAEKYLVLAMGAPAGTAIHLGSGVAAAFHGDVDGAARLLLPTGLRNFYKTGAMVANGLVDKDGDVFKPASELSWPDITQTMLGLQPAGIQEAYRSRSAAFGVKGRVGAVRSELIQAYRTASPEDRAAVQAKIDAYNETVPVGFSIKPKELTASVKSKAERESGAQTKQDREVSGMLQ